MSHSHLPVEHLLKQVELYKSRKQNRGVRPDWVSNFIERVAGLFEPLAGEGRVGFDCQLLEDRWMVALYLGATEIVGGSEDGQLRYTNFQFDLSALLERFCEVGSVVWRTLPERTSAPFATPSSSITIDGQVDGHALRVQISSIPPIDAGAGFRQLTNGQREQV